MKKLNFGSKSGVTLIELLVVILIVIILSVSLLPILRPFVVKAKYAAEGIPTIGHIRTLVTMFYTEHDRIPGVQAYLNADGEEVYGMTSKIDVPVDGATFNWAGAVQSLRMVAAVGGAPADANQPTWLAAGDASDVTEVADARIPYHFSRNVELSATDLQGKNAKPNHFQFLVMDSGYGDTSYAYAAGSFGDGDGVPAGTGYAVIEIQNAKNENRPKLTAVWQRYKEEESTQQICLAVQSAAAMAATITSKTDVQNVLPIAQELIDDGTVAAGTTFDDTTAIAAMRAAGWEIF